MKFIDPITLSLVVLSALLLWILRNRNSLKGQINLSEKKLEQLSEQLRQANLKLFRVGDVVYVHYDQHDHFGNSPHYIYEIYNGGKYAKITNRKDWEDYSKTTHSVSTSNAIEVIHLSHEPLKCCNRCGKPL